MTSTNNILEYLLFTFCFSYSVLKTTHSARIQESFRHFVLQIFCFLISYFFVESLVLGVFANTSTKNPDNIYTFAKKIKKAFNQQKSLKNDQNQANIGILFGQIAQKYANLR